MSRFSERIYELRKDTWLIAIYYHDIKFGIYTRKTVL